MALTGLNLKAVWLSENQAQPMLNFQTEVRSINNYKNYYNNNKKHFLILCLKTHLML